MDKGQISLDEDRPRRVEPGDARGKERERERERERRLSNGAGGRSVGERVVEGVLVKLSWRWLCAGSICRLVICCPGSGHSTFRTPISIPTVL